MQEQIKPNYYKFNIKGVDFDVFDIAKAMNLPNTLFNALKYFRVKGDAGKKINDLEKAVECINREIQYIKDENDISYTKKRIDYLNEVINEFKKL